MNNYHGLRGTALISALLIMSIAALLSSAAIISLRLLIYQTELTVHNDQLYEYLLGADDWAQMVILSQADLRKVKSLNINIAGAHISGKIYAQQGLFNINSLGSAVNEAAFVRLLNAVRPQISLTQANTLAQSINAYIAAPTLHDDPYFQLNPPYRPAHQWLVTLSELRAVIGMDATTYQALQPFITALPTPQNNIDINYAPLPVLLTLSDKITLSQAKALLDCRNTHGVFATLVDFMKICNPDPNTPLNGLSTQENYYLLRATATQGHQQLSVVSLLELYQNQNGKKVKVIWQQLNTDP